MQQTVKNWISHERVLRAVSSTDGQRAIAIVGTAGYNSLHQLCAYDDTFRTESVIENVGTTFAHSDDLSKFLYREDNHLLYSVDNVTFGIADGDYRPLAVSNAGNVIAFADKDTFYIERFSKNKCVTALPDMYVQQAVINRTGTHVAFVEGTRLKVYKYQDDTYALTHSMSNESGTWDDFAFVENKLHVMYQQDSQTIIASLDVTDAETLRDEIAMPVACFGYPTECGHYVVRGTNDEASKVSVYTMEDNTVRPIASFDVEHTEWVLGNHKTARFFFRQIVNEAGYNVLQHRTIM